MTDSSTNSVMMNMTTDDDQKWNMRSETAISDLHRDCTALCARLSAASDPTTDDDLRQAIADLAARMLLLTATREAGASPIPALLAKADADNLARSKLLAILREKAPNLISEPT